uniref:Ubiquitin conjugating enzyme E2 E2 n=1 Tax=Rhinolophus ferrumequinum TaxID=59479 RepID=A0A671EUB0_RHIFE
MSTEAQRVDDSPSTSGGSSDGDQRESVQQEPEREQVQPKKKEGKISSKTAAKLSTSAKRIQKELAEITLDPPPNCRLLAHRTCCYLSVRRVKTMPEQWGPENRISTHTPSIHDGHGGSFCLA